MYHSDIMDSAEFHQTLAENIALLRLLSNVPEPPTLNTPPVDLLADNSGDRRLKFKKECDLVDNLAFISAVSDDPEKVTAVCIEEHRDHRGMTVVLAVNKGNLSSVKEGFERIFRILKEVSSKSK